MYMDMNYYCPICKKEFKDLSVFSEHMAIHAKANEDDKIKAAKEAVENAYSTLCKAVKEYNRISKQEQVRVNIFWKNPTPKTNDNIKKEDNACNCKTDCKCNKTTSENKDKLSEKEANDILLRRLFEEIFNI